jgi:hypothetical protein
MKLATAMGYTGLTWTRDGDKFFESDPQPGRLEFMLKNAALFAFELGKE